MKQEKNNQFLTMLFFYMCNSHNVRTITIAKSLDSLSCLRLHTHYEGISKSSKQHILLSVCVWTVSAENVKGGTLWDLRVQESEK